MSARWIVLLLASGCLSPPDRGQGDGPGGEDGGGDGDAAPGGDAGPDLACGTLSAVREEFDVLSEYHWVESGASVVNGALELGPDADTTFAILLGRASWLVEEGALEVHVDVSQLAPDAFFWVSLWQGINRVSLRLSGDTLEVWVQDAQGDGSRDSVAFDTDMTWWRLSHDGDAFRWATSPDGDDWTDHGSFTASLSGLAAIGLEHSFGGSDTTVRVESINGGGTGAKTCPLSALVDDFTAASTRWASTQSGSCDVDTQGDLTVQASMPGTFCGLVSLQRFSMVEERLSVELVDAGTCAQIPMLAAVLDDAAFTMTCRPDGEGGANLVGGSVVGGGPSSGFTATYSPDDHQFLAFRHVPDEGVRFETSPDGVSWEPHGTVPSSDLAGVDLESVEVRVGVTTPSDKVTPEDVTFDRVNAP